MIAGGGGVTVGALCVTLHVLYTPIDVPYGPGHTERRRGGPCRQTGQPVT